MSTLTTREARIRRHRRVRGKVAGTAGRPRLVVFRSNRGISAQLVARYANATLPVDVPASLVFLGNQLYFTNLSLFDGGVNSSIAVLQTQLPGLPPL